MAKYVLKSNWDTPINYPHKKESGHFCGRLTELQTIENYLSRRDSSSILLIGHRGVGKTSLLKKCLHNLKIIKDKRIFPVFVNAPQLQLKGSTRNEPIDPEHLFKTLITRVYKTTEYYTDKELGKELKKLSQNLYKKSAANTFKDVYKDLETEKDSSSTIYSRVLTTTINDLTKFILAILVAIISLYMSFSNIVEVEVGWRILIALAGISLPAVISFKSESKFESNAEQVQEVTAEKYYFFDNDLSNIEFDLEKLQEKFFDNGIKIVYIFDEMDKVEGDVLKQVVNEFKNFFTLGHAHYVFVTDEKMADSLPRIGSETRDINYTYFHNHFYISRPLEIGLLTFLKEIEQKQSSELDETERDNLFKHLIFSAKGDYFDLLRVVQNHINEYSGGLPIIEFKDDYYEKIKKKSKFQQAITLVFSQKYESSHKEKWRQNETIISELYNFAHELFYLEAAGQASDTGASQGNYLAFSAKQDLATLLSRIGFISQSTEQDTVIKGVKVKTRKYVSTHDFSKEIPSSLEFLSDWEEKFIETTLGFIQTTTRLIEHINVVIDKKISYEDFENKIDEFISVLEEIRNSGVGLNLVTSKAALDTLKALRKPIPDTFKNHLVATQEKSVLNEEAKVTNTPHTFITNAWNKKFLSSQLKTSVTTVNKNTINRQPFLQELDEDFKTRLVSQPNHVITNAQTNRKHILLVKDNVGNIFRGIENIYKDKELENYTHEFKVVVFSKSKSSTATFKCLDVFDSSIENWQEIVTEIEDWFYAQTRA